MVVRHSDLDGMLARMYKLKEEAADFRAQNGTEFAALEIKVIETMDELGLTEYDGKEFRGKLTRKFSDEIDWDGLEAALPPALWEMIAPRTGDKEKLEAAVRLGKIKVGTAKKFTSKKPQKPYVTTSEVKA